MRLYFKSLEIQQSPIGHIARSLALVGAGKQEVALDDFDLVFRDGDLDDNMLLLVIKVRVRRILCIIIKFILLSLHSCSCVANGKKQYHDYLA